MGHKFHQHQAHGANVTKETPLVKNGTQKSPAPGSRNVPLVQIMQNYVFLKNRTANQIVGKPNRIVPKNVTRNPSGAITHLFDPSSQGPERNICRGQLRSAPGPKTPRACQASPRFPFWRFSSVSLNFIFDLLCPMAPPGRVPHQAFSLFCSIFVQHVFFQIRLVFHILF